MRTKAAVKYAATKLQEKGVLLVLACIIQPRIILNIESLQNIGDLPPNQLKNVQFIFLPLEQEGVFEVQYFIVWEFHLKLNVGVCKVYGGRYGEDGGGPSAFAKTSI